MDKTASEAAGQKWVTVFFCYAHEDELLLNQLKNHLQPLQRQGLIQLWYDREIRAGSEWEPEIKKQLDAAQIILLLISPDFMASDYCYSIEMKRALERHRRGEAIVIPIILRPVYWHGEPLGRLQALPTDGKPVTDSDWRDPDRAFYNVTNGIYQVIEKLTAASSIASPTGTISNSRLETVQSENTTPHILQRDNSAPFPNRKQQKISPALDPTKLALFRTLAGNKSNVLSVTLNADGLLLAAGGGHKTVKLWNTKTGQLLHTLKGQTGFSNPVYCVALSANGLILAICGLDKTIGLWNTQTGQLFRTLKGHTDPVCSVAWSADGLLLASGSWDQTVKLWNTQTGQFLHTLKGHTSFVESVAWSPDGLTLASGSRDKTVKLWNTQTGQLARGLNDHTDELWSVAWSADGLTLASGSRDKTVKLWNTQTGQLLRTLDHTDPVYSVAWSADGLLLASSGQAHTIKLWNTQTGQLLHSLNGHTDAVQSVAWSADGLILASGSSDKTVKLWVIKP